MGYESFIALRYLRSKRKEVFISIITIISVIGVALSVVVLDIVMAVMTGFETELQSKLVDANPHVLIRRYGGLLEDYDEIIERVQNVDGVLDVFPYTHNQAMLSTSSGAKGVLVRGISNRSGAKDKVSKFMSDTGDMERLFQPSPIEVERPDGTLDSVKLPSILIGQELGRSLGLRTDEPVTLFAPRFSASPQGIAPKLRRFYIVDQYHSGLIEYEATLAYTSIGTAQAFFGLGERVTGVELVVDELLSAPEVAERVREELSTLSTEGMLEVADWTQQNKPLWDAIKLEKRVYFIVLLLLILVASFSIVSTLVMVVMEKGRDIAVLKSMGATDKSVMKIFLMQGSIIGAAGVVLGTILGYLGCLFLKHYEFELDERVFSLDSVPVVINVTNVLLVAVAGLVITAAAGIYPAFRASRLKPADALRYE